MTRRGVLTALGGVGTVGVAAGTVVARGGPGRRSGRVIDTDRGIVIQWEDCETAHVRGSGKKLDELVVYFSVCFGGGGPCPDGSRVEVEPDLPMTIDDRFLSVDPPDYRIDVIEYHGDGGRGFARVPDEWDCSLDD